MDTLHTPTAVLEKSEGTLLREQAPFLTSRLLQLERGRFPAPGGPEPARSFLRRVAWLPFEEAIERRLFFRLLGRLLNSRVLPAFLLDESFLRLLHAAYLERVRPQLDALHRRAVARGSDWTPVYNDLLELAETWREEARRPHFWRFHLGLWTAPDDHLPGWDHTPALIREVDRLPPGLFRDLMVRCLPDHFPACEGSLEQLREEIWMVADEPEGRSAGLREESSWLFFADLYREGAMLAEFLLRRLIREFLVSRDFAALRQLFSGQEWSELARETAKAQWLELWTSIHYPSLARLLFGPEIFARYAPLAAFPFRQIIGYLPRFAVLHIGDHLAGRQQRHWILWLAAGNNIRHAEGLPVRMSRRMSHWFAQAPPTASFHDAFLFGVVRGLDGSTDLFGCLHPEWATILRYPEAAGEVIRFFARRPECRQRGELRLLIRYLHHLHGELGERFSMKGRTLPALRRQAQAFDEAEREARQQTRERTVERVPLNWKGFAFASYERREGHATFRIEQLTSQTMLEAEGSRLRHCVATYAYRCAFGHTSIWSLRRYEGKGSVSLVTLQVSPGGTLVQARGMGNRAPNEDEWLHIQRWLRRTGIKKGEIL